MATKDTAASCGATDAASSPASSLGRFQAARVAVVVSSLGGRSAPACADPFADNDAVRIAALLRAYGYSVHLLRREEAQRRCVAAVMRTCHERSPTGILGSFLLLAFAPARVPPAAQEKQRGQQQQDPHLLLEDAVLRDPSTWLPLAELRAMYAAVPCGSKSAFVFGIRVPLRSLQVGRAAHRLETPRRPRGVACGFL
eukprot:Rhum_TRINITY_DN3680_c0_g1::Rhum_TRINITY_DN3680_c0_g1_i1::g.11669::m.11669